MARVALAKSKQRFAGHVNVAPFRAARGYGFEISLSPASGENLKLSGRGKVDESFRAKFDLSSEQVFLFLIFKDFC